MIQEGVHWSSQSLSVPIKHQCPSFPLTAKYSQSVSWGMLKSIQTAILTHHSENMPTLHRKKLILELNPGLSCLRPLRQQSASAPAAHPYKPAQASALWLFFPPDSRCRMVCQAAATGLVFLWAQAEVNRIAVSSCASQRSTQDTLWLLQCLHLFTPGSLHLERERGLAASVWHTHTHSLTHSLSLLLWLCWLDGHDSDIYPNKCRYYSL